jgi:aminomethyltransferase
MQRNSSLTFIQQPTIKTHMKNTPFTEKHIALGAKMAPFAGYNMPISYTGINDEHSTVRNNAGVFDVSHMGEFILKGEHALDLIQRITSNDAAKLTSGKAQYSCLPNNEGGIVDDLLVYCIEENKVYMLVVNASNIEKDWNWIMQHNTEEKEDAVAMHNVSNKTCLLAIQGPNATKLLQPLVDKDILNLKYYTFVKGIFAGVENVLISATGYTGAGGVEIYFENTNDNADTIWNAIAALGIKPIGLAARDTLRLEMGYCLYGNDIDDTTSPLEAGLGWVTKFSKNFTAKHIIEKQKAQGIKRKLVGFEMVERGIPRHDYVIKDAAGNTIGKVTSGTQAPTLSKAIGMGYVTIENATVDTEIFIDIRNTPVKAKVVKMPFV